MNGSLLLLVFSFLAFGLLAFVSLVLALASAYKREDDEWRGR